MLVPCAQCNRHVKDAESRCPFCSASMLRGPVGAAVLTAAMTLAACGGEPKGSATPPPDPTAPTATATGTTPTLPTAPTAAPTMSATATATTTATAPQPDRNMAPRYGMPPQKQP